MDLGLAGSGTHGTKSKPSTVRTWMQIIIYEASCKLSNFTMGRDLIQGKINLLNRKIKIQ